MEEQTRSVNGMGVSYDALPLWKKKRRLMVEELIITNLHDYVGFRLPSNLIRSNKKLFLKNVKVDEQEIILFDDFLTLCRGSNTSTIQCELDENADEIKFAISQGTDESLSRWLHKCFTMVSNLFYLECCVARLRCDSTRGPVVYTFCSVVTKYLRKSFYPGLIDLEKLPRKNLLTLQRKCAEFNNIIQPLKDMALEIEQFDYVGGELINIFFNASQADRNFHIADLLQKIISLALKRYYEVIFEWISQCTLTFDLAHEFFVWDLSKVKCVRRTEFPKNQSDGTQFDERFVVILELCPDILKPVSDKIIEVGKYLHIMQSQNGDLRLLAPQLLMDARVLRDRSISEFRSAIRGVYERCSTSIMEHLIERFDIGNFALRLSNYFLGYGSAWIEELVELYEECQISAMSSAQLTFHVLRQLSDRALDADWLHNDVFRNRIELGVSPFYDTGTPVLELKFNWDKSLNLAFPNRILETYRRLFRLAFVLQRTRYLLYRKRFFDSSFLPSRQELSTLFLMIRFVNVYHDFIFVTVVDEAHSAFLPKFLEVENLDNLVDIQFNFLCRILKGAFLDLDKTCSSDIMNLITLFAAYARNELKLDELTIKAAPLINSIKKTFIQNRDYASLRNILFGSNFYIIGDADQEPLWMSLRHVEPMK